MFPFSGRGKNGEFETTGASSFSTDGERLSSFPAGKLKNRNAQQILSRKFLSIEPGVISVKVRLENEALRDISSDSYLGEISHMNTGRGIHPYIQVNR